MKSEVFASCLPWMCVLALAVVIARLLVWFSNARPQPAKVKSLHGCEKGSVQSLSFVLTLPFFLMILMLLVQVGQIMIANVVVHYAAFNSARSAVVWIPTSANIDETENRISSFSQIQRTAEGTQYRVHFNPDSPKFAKIKQAAVIACAPLAPSRDLGYSRDANGQLTSSALVRTYAGLDADSLSNNLISRRIENKIAYADANTEVQIEFWHRVGPFHNYQDAPLQQRYFVAPYRDEFYPNELGWQDEITTTVTHNLSLLPGPVRLISRLVREDETGQSYIYPVAASATMVNEGEKPLLSYWQEEIQ